MEPKDFLEIAAPSFGTILAVSPLLQARLMHKNKTSDGISFAYATIIFVAMILWFAYGVSIISWPLIIPNFVAMFTNGLVVSMILYYRQKETNPLTP